MLRVEFIDLTEFVGHYLASGSPQQRPLKVMVLPMIMIVKEIMLGAGGGGRVKWLSADQKQDGDEK